MTYRALAELDGILETAAEADDVLRRVVALLASQDGIDWAGVAFLEGEDLKLGPTAGRENEQRRVRIPIPFQGDTVGELLVDGGSHDELTAQVAAKIAPYVLIGWDTGGEAWEP
jgi:hypothetical protein